MNGDMDLWTFLTSGILAGLVLIVIWFFLFTDSDMILAIADAFGRPVSDFAGKVVWVTGASTGLGEAMSYELASVGAKLILTARGEDKLLIVRDECIERSKGKLSKEDILILSFDISHVECHKEKVEKAVTHFKRIDYLINNAARYQVGEIIETDLSVDRTIFDINFFGPVSLSKLLVKQFLKQGGGHIVVVSSIAGRFGIPSTATYAATKHALQGYFDTLHMEYKNRNISVTKVVPGIFSSSILEKTITTSTDKILQKEYEHYECTNMTSERCAHLTLAASINHLIESWVAYQPFLLMLWSNQYIPDLYKLVMMFLYSKKRVYQLYQGKWPSDLPVWQPIIRRS